MPRKRTLKILAIVTVVVSALFAWTSLMGDSDQGFVHQSFRDSTGEEFKYVLFVPHSYRSQTQHRYPLLVYLHGSGASGSDGEKQIEGGLATAIRVRESGFEFLALFPQSRERTWHADSADGRQVMSILAETEAAYRVDPRRIYLTGYSLGGYGAWSLAVRYPDKWAAIVPVCGVGNPADAATIRAIPCWCFHGETDDVVPLRASQEMIDALQREGGEPRFTVYPQAGHGIADKVYNNPELFDWLSRQCK